MKNYHDIIFNEYLRRRSLDKKYSQRDFARDLGIKYALLNKVLNGEKGLSKLNALQVARKLGLSTMESKQFRFLVSAQSGRSKAERTLANQWLKFGSSKMEAENRKAKT